MPFLVWDSPRGRNVRELDRTLVVIGRDAGADLVIDDATVSRRHALVQVEGTVKITDLRSSTGTRINGARLAPDVPCTLEPGDFLQVGKVVFSFHAAPPPPAPPSPPPRAAARPRAAPWKAAVVVLAFVAVVGVAVLLALPKRREPPPLPAELAAKPEPLPAPEPPPPPPAPAKVAIPAPEKPAVPVPPPPPAEPERAVAGELPPKGAAPELPDLIEVDGTTHLAARVKTIGDSIEAIGADGRLYSIPGKRVTRIEDRADLERRVAVERRRLAPDDVARRVALAEWCLARLLRDEARALVREALSLAPGDGAARALDVRLRELE